MFGIQSLGGPKRKHLDDEVLSSYIDGTLSPRDKIVVTQHVAECAECANNLDTLRRTALLLKDLPQVKVPRAFTLSEADVAPQRVRRRQSSLFVFLRGATAAVAIMFAVVVAGDLVLRGGFATVPPVFEGAVKSVQVAEREMLAPRAPDVAAPQAMESDTTVIARAAIPSPLVERVVVETVVVEKEVELEVEAEIVIKAEPETSATKAAQPTIAQEQEKVMKVQIAETATPTPTSTMSIAQIVKEAQEKEAQVEEMPAGIGGGAEMPGPESGEAEDGISEMTLETALKTPTPTPPQPTATVSSPTLAPTLAPSTLPATSVAEILATPIAPASESREYGVPAVGKIGLPLIRLVEIALLLIVLALASAAIASRQRR